MVAKTIFVLCASALFIQSISAQCIGYNSASAVNLAAARPWAGFGCGGVQGAVASGGGLTVSSTSPITPTGVTIVSENAIEGPLDIAGQLPVLSAVTIEGQMPTGGAAGTSYSCGNGDVSISADSLAAAGVGAGNAGFIGAGINGIGAGLNGIGSGFNGIGTGFNGINAGLLNAGTANAGLNAGLAGTRLGGLGCGSIY